MGVPQGSVVAPLLFTLLIADVGKGVRGDTIVTAYADDIALWRKTRHRRPKRDSTQHRAELRHFQSQIDLVVTQLTSLGFSLSAAKTTYMPVHQIGFNSGTYPEWNHIKICGTPVRPAKSVRYLGVTFQRDGRWSQHIQQVTFNARRALNLSLVRSRLLFGAAVLHDLSRDAVHKLTLIECQALRVGLGLPRLVPHEQVYSEAGILPLWRRIKRDACRYFFSSARVPNSTDEELSEGWVAAPPTEPVCGLPISVKDICLQAGLQPGDRRLVAQNQQDPFPPWTYSPPEVRTEVYGLGRQASHHLLLESTKKFLAEHYAGDFLVYTDGSVLEDGRTGAGFYLQSTRETFSIRLPPTTILTAELVAIREALIKIIALPQKPPRVTILSDSRSSLTVLQGAHCTTRPDVLNDILRLSAEAAQMGVCLQYQWVPSHVGLQGNEKADRAARQGALAPEEEAIPIQLTASDMYRMIDRAVWDMWKAEYAATAVSRG
ncbi:uncharacterized protein LOC143023659 [Oratosquilla oratoria]|uniref:uncharacterized protein LOC143023659 n=1 Tax=Oratosquilla oratoria TaxID=337810 RepID=UPI003F7705CE